MLAVLPLLHLKLDLPVGSDRHEAVLEPNQVFAVAPVRRKHALALVNRLRSCLWYLAVYYVFVYVPVDLRTKNYFFKPTA
jgi:hypothetical protein